ncbi:hypothetical protein G5B37_12815 [Rasiella rasia]|uniref:Uncharacterized protein n=1 Tax=Rasiella rasia TaxID=2744027 RepID=A0A6G6GRS8_9FLAO|nr:hypothetical protein [Rasiella rasia]QIE60411.1 hypothetical protein G5B37_12815 [Rasiella rasia]
MKNFVYLLITAICCTFISCEDEPIGTAEINLDIVDEELFTYLQLITNDVPTEESINCIEFNYSFTIFIFDENLTYEGAQAVFNNEDFVALLNSLDETQSISLNYPISGTLSNGDLIEVTTNEELKEAISNCSKDEHKRRCNNTLVDCIWTVRPFQGFPTNYVGSNFKINRNGTIQFHHEGNVYFGTWVTLYIGDDLFLNIDLNNDTTIESFWDLNWEVSLLTDTQIKIDANDTSVLIEKDCSIPCSADGYQICELDNTPGIAQFALQDYTSCIPVAATHDVVSAVKYSFFATEEDALNNSNPLSATNYTNIENPQTIYVRLDYITSGENLEITQITIEAIPCIGG